VNWANILPFLGSLVIAALAYLVQKRRQSGQIQTSEAADLWNESKDIREYQAKEMANLRAELETLKQRLVVVEKEALDCLQRERVREGRDG
jgi:hypothetical protein